MNHIHSLARDGFRPGLIGRCTSLMARFYSDKFGLGAEFEIATARGLAGFVQHFEAQRDALWWLQRDAEILGCAAVDAQQGPAQLRWFYLGAALRGRGLGRQLLQQALAFARGAGHTRLTLSTHADLQAAVRLYEGHGFVHQGHSAGMHWGRPLVLQHYAMALRRDASALQHDALALPGAAATPPLDARPRPLHAAAATH